MTAANSGPFGLAGGAPGQVGRNTLLREGQLLELPGKCSLAGRPGDVLIIETPGGGAWGAKAPADEEDDHERSNLG